MTDAKARNKVLMYTRNLASGEIGFKGGYFATGKTAPNYHCQPITTVGFWLYLTLVFGFYY
jgi:hypothetical protein